MTVRFTLPGIAGPLLVWSLLTPSPIHAVPQGSDVFSTSGEYERFAVGGAHKWYDNHSTEANQKSTHCLSILDETKAFQDKAARQPRLYKRGRTPLSC